MRFSYCDSRRGGGGGGGGDEGGGKRTLEWHKGTLEGAEQYPPNVYTSTHYTWWNFIPKNLAEQFRRFTNQCVLLFLWNSVPFALSRLMCTSLIGCVALYMQCMIILLSFTFNCALQVFPPCDDFDIDAVLADPALY